MSNKTPFTAEAFQEDLAFIKENNINVLFVEPDTKKGFEFPYLVYLPQNPQTTLIMDCLNDYESPMLNNTTENLSAIQEVYSLFEERGYEPKYNVRADYEHFLWCFYKKKAKICYLPVMTAAYEGGGYSETKEHRRQSAKQHKEIT